MNLMCLLLEWDAGYLDVLGGENSLMHVPNKRFLEKEAGNYRSEK